MQTLNEGRSRDYWTLSLWVVVIGCCLLCFVGAYVVASALVEWLT